MQRSWYTLYASMIKSNSRGMAATDIARTRAHRARETEDEGEPPPWDLRLYTREDTFTTTTSSENAPKDAADAWQRFLSGRPLLYLPDRKPHGDCDAHVDRGRKLWRRDELQGFDAVVEQRTQALLRQQQAVLHHWRHAATRIQARMRGYLARRRVERMRQQLYEEMLAAARARELAALCRRQLHAAILIQRVYHGHCTHLHYMFACRMRLQRSIRLYVFRWLRLRAARIVQRAFRQYRRREKLWKALRTVIRLLRMSHQREQLEAAAVAFHKARHDEIERKRQQKWERHPREMVDAKRVQERKVRLQAELLPRKRRSKTHEKVESHRRELPILISSQRRNQSPSGDSSVGRTSTNSSSSLPLLA